MPKVSVIVPARHEPYLAKTVEDVLAHATGDVEVIVVLDGWTPDAPMKDDGRLRLIHNATSVGLRESVNMAVRAATGEFVMKIDAHTAFAPGFDKVLQSDLAFEDLSVPSRYSLDAENWKQGYGPIEFLYQTWPFVADSQFGIGLHGRKWIGENGNEGSNRPASYYFLERQRADIKIDEIQGFQGSCWFMHRQRFLDMGGLDGRFGTFFAEPNELGFKVWLSGGRVLVNKNTHYGHHHKTKPPGYGFSRNQKHQTGRYTTWYFFTNQWRGTNECPVKRTFQEFVKRWSPIPGWPNDWEQQSHTFLASHSDWAIPPIC